MSNFLEILRDEILKPRFAMLMEHGESWVRTHFDELSLRMAWYNTVNLYKAKCGTDVLDLVGDGGKQFKRFEAALNDFCRSKTNVDKAKKLNPKYGVYWGELRKALNIEAKGRAVIFGCPGNNILVVPENRSTYLGKGLFAVICEKETLGKKWLAEMQRRGWRDAIYLMITGGFSTCEVIETLMDEKARIDAGKTRFHVGILHDCDLSGHMILWDIQKQFPDAVDMGLNFDMLETIGPMTWNDLKEPCTIGKDIVTGAINAGLQDLVTSLETGAAVKTGKNYYCSSYRVELDNLYVSKGISVFCDYAEQQIAKYFKMVDLNRVDKPSVEDPDDLRDIRKEINALWENICIKAIGKSDKDTDWTEPADKALEDDELANKDFEPEDLEALRHYGTHINQQSDDLQKIVNEDPENVKRIAQIQDLLDKLGILKVLDELGIDKIEIKDHPTMPGTENGQSKPKDISGLDQDSIAILKPIDTTGLGSNVSDHARTDPGSMPALEPARDQVQSAWIDECQNCHRIYTCKPILVDVYGRHKKIPCKTICECGSRSLLHKRNESRKQPGIADKLKELEDKKKREEAFKQGLKKGEG